MESQSEVRDHDIPARWTDKSLYSRANHMRFMLCRRIDSSRVHDRLGGRREDQVSFKQLPFVCMYSRRDRIQ